jgi:hypothetical protein
VKAWSIVDSTTIQVRAARLEACPGTGDAAALKRHNVLSVGGGAPVRSHCSPARDHDRPQRQIDDAWRGYGLLADRADASLARLRAGETSAVRCVIRLKDHWTPQVDDLARGQVIRECCPGTDLEALREEATLVRAGPAMDAAGHGGGGTHPLPLRLVGVQTPNGDGFFRTNVPPRIGPLQVADLDRVRWAVERRIQRDQSVHRLDQIDAERPCALKTL